MPNQPSRNILYISFDGMTDPLGQSQVIPYLAGLSAEGYRFTILSFDKPERYEKEGAKIRALLNAANIDWEPQEYLPAQPLMKKLGYRRAMVQKAIELQGLKKFDLIHCRSYPASGIGRMMKKKFGAKFIFDMRGFWPDEKAESGQWNVKKPWYKAVYNFYKSSEKKFLTDADCVVSLTQAGKDELIKVYSKSLGGENLEEKIKVIPCCADLAHFNYNNVKEEDRKALKSRLGIPEGVKVLSYSGSLGTWYMMDEMLAFFNQFLLRYPDAIFLCLSKEPKEVMDAHLAKSGVDPSKIVMTFSNREELPLHLSLADYSIFFIYPTYSKLASCPTKHAELMGLGIPVICNDFGDTGAIVRATGVGALVKKFDVLNYATALSMLDSLPKAPSAEIREVAHQYYDLQEGIKKYSAIYAGLLGKELSPIETAVSSASV